MYSFMGFFVCVEVKKTSSRCRLLQRGELSRWAWPVRRWLWGHCRGAAGQLSLGAGHACADSPLPHPPTIHLQTLVGSGWCRCFAQRRRNFGTWWHQPSAHPGRKVRSESSAPQAGFSRTVPWAACPEKRFYTWTLYRIVRPRCLTPD